MNPAASTRPVRRVAAAVLVPVLVALVAAGSACSGDRSSGASGAGAPPAGRPSAPARPGAPPRASGPSSGCDRVPAARAGTTDATIRSRGVERRYQLVVPEGYDGTTPLPVVFGLHSLTIDYHVVVGMAGFTDMARTRDFIAVAPSGRLGPTGLPYWNAADVADNDDVAFLAGLLDRLEATLCVDRSRVFSVGMSNGAQMSSLLACRLDGRIAAIAPIAGVEIARSCDGPPVGVIAFHGRADPIVPYAGGGLDARTIAAMNRYGGRAPAGTPASAGVDRTMVRWAQHNGCDPDPVEKRVSTEVRRRVWRGCDAPTVLYVVDDGGHAWPGKPQPAFEASNGHTTTDIDATTLIFRFFLDDREG